MTWSQQSDLSTGLFSKANFTLKIQVIWDVIYQLRHHNIQEDMNLQHHHYEHLVLNDKSNILKFSKYVTVICPHFITGDGILLLFKYYMLHI